MEIPIEQYREMMLSRGATRKEALLRREQRYIADKIRHNQSYHSAIVDGKEQMVSIANSDNLNEKMIFSMPNEDLRHGAYVYWMGNWWLITERDANTTVYTRCKMIQCNHLLRWVNDEDQICEIWSIVEDGTKYLTGEFDDRNFIATRGDTRLSITMSRTPETLKFNRQSRFIIDDPDSGEQLAYALSKPLRMGSTYNGNGVFKFVLQEVVTTDYDNLREHIADYYKHFPTDYSVDSKAGEVQYTETDTERTERKNWL